LTFVLLPKGAFYGLIWDTLCLYPHTISWSSSSEHPAKRGVTIVSGTDLTGMVWLFPVIAGEISPGTGVGITVSRY